MPRKQPVPKRAIIAKRSQATILVELISAEQFIRRRQYNTEEEYDAATSKVAQLQKDLYRMEFHENMGFELISIPDGVVDIIRDYI
jgi:hypothetical protein